MKHDMLFTNQRRSRLGLGSPYCRHCRSEVESVLHVLRDCPKAIETWQFLVRREVRSSFFFGNLQSWIYDNLNHKFGWDVCGAWVEIWATTCYFL